MTDQQRKRLKRLRNRLRRNHARLDAVLRLGPARGILPAFVRSAVSGDDLDFEETVDAVSDALDDLIEPRNPILEWASDVGIDVAAHVAVMIYQGTEHRIERRIGRLARQIQRLEKLQ